MIPLKYLVFTVKKWYLSVESPGRHNFRQVIISNACQHNVLRDEMPHSQCIVGKEMQFRDEYI